MNGFLNVYKESGMTSHDVVAKLRKILNTKAIGHTGTLDPNATGVLPIAVGVATKAITYLEQDDKIYKAELTLGITTDTEDIWGKVVKEKNVKDFTLTDEEIESVIKSFIGKIKQIPPMYSAIKVNGKKLYELARDGIEIERAAREIEIFDIFDIEILNEKVRFTVHCSKGTYVRTLCSDIGYKLGCGAVMSNLERIKAGQFNIETSQTLKEIECSPNFIKTDEILNFSSINLGINDGIKYKNGVKIGKNEKAGRYKIYIDNKFYGVGYVEEDLLRAEKKISEE